MPCFIAPDSGLLEYRAGTTFQHRPNSYWLGATPALRKLLTQPLHEILVLALRLCAPAIERVITRPKLPGDGLKEQGDIVSGDMSQYAVFSIPIALK
jgi:hypothetical protein